MIRVLMTPEIVEQMLTKGHAIRAACIHGLVGYERLVSATMENHNGALYLALYFGDGQIDTTDLTPTFERLER